MSDNKLFINEQKLGSTMANHLYESRQVIVQNWDNVGLLEGIEDPIMKYNLAQLFENELTYLKKKRAITESTDSYSSGAFETVAFPVIRRVFANLLANKIVSVQALNMSLGKLFYINPKVSVRYDDADFAGDERHYHPDNAYANRARTRDKFGVNGGPEPETLVQYQDKSLYDSYYATLTDGYGDALFDHSKGRITPQSGTTSIVSGTIGVDRTIRVTIDGLQSANDGSIVGPSGTRLDTESFLSSLRLFPSGGNLLADSAYTSETLTTADTVNFNVIVQKYGSAIVNSAGQLTIDVDMQYAGDNDSNGRYPVFGTGSTATNFVYIYNDYSNLEADSEMGEVTFEMEEVTVATTTRKLRAQWTPELAVDIKQYHNIDAEAELTQLLSEHMASEVDREILRDLRVAAPWTARWDYAGLAKTNGTFYGTQKDWNQTFINKIMQISAQIQKATLRGGANWIVISPEISAILNDLEYFHVTQDGDPSKYQYNVGIEQIGTLRGQITVYVDAYAPANTCLIGRKGSSILETGYIYAPYVPMELTGVITDPKDFTSVRGIMTRYGKKIVNNRFYGKVLVDNVVSYGVGDLQ